MYRGAHSLKEEPTSGLRRSPCYNQTCGNAGRAFPSAHMQSPTMENASHSSSPQTILPGPTPEVPRAGREADHLRDVPATMSRPQMRLQTDSSDTIRPISRQTLSQVSLHRGSSNQECKDSDSKRLTPRSQAIPFGEAIANQMPGHSHRSQMSSLISSSRAAPIAASPTFGSRTFPPSVTPDQALTPGPSSPSSLSESYMTTSLDSLAAKLTVSPQTIPESKRVDHSLDAAFDRTVSPLMSPTYESNNPLSRNSSTRSLLCKGTVKEHHPRFVCECQN